MTDQLKRFLASRSGATAIEYGLLASLIAVAIIATLIGLGGKMQTTYNEISSNMK